MFKLVLLSIALLSSTAGFSKTKIAIIDSGIDLAANPSLKKYMCESGHKSFIPNEGIIDNPTTPHGTNVTGLVMDGLDSNKYCFIVIKIFPQDDMRLTQEDFGDLIGNAVDYAVFLKVSFINISMQGRGYRGTEFKALRNAIKKNIKITVAAGNFGENLDKKCNVYPACYKVRLKSNNYRVVGAYKTYFLNKTNIDSNYGKIVEYKEDGVEKGIPKMSGTSQSAPIHLNKWIKFL